MKGRNPLRVPFIAIGYVFVMVGLAFESFRMWVYFGIPLLIVGVILGFLDKRNTG
jgi:hypothetical protein